MKKCLLVCFGIVLLLLTACAAEHSTPEQLVEDYFVQVKNANYEAIWDMLPGTLRKYAVDTGMVDDRTAGIAFTAYAVNDYYWLRELDLPARSSYRYEILESSTGSAQELVRYLAKKGIVMSIEEIGSVQVRVYADDVVVDGSFYLLRADGQWWLTSVVGDDELVEY